MQTQVTFRHTKSNPVLHTAANDSSRKFEKFFEDIISSDVVFSDDADKLVELTVRVKGETLVVKEASDDFMKSLNEGTDKMIRQIRKWKQKVYKKN